MKDMNGLLPIQKQNMTKRSYEEFSDELLTDEYIQKQTHEWLGKYLSYQTKKLLQQIVIRYNRTLELGRTFY